MRVDRTQHSEFGDFALVPEEGYRLRSFIDLESQLLIISESLIDLSKVPIEHGIRSVPTTQFIVAPKERRILNPEEWTKFFGYEKTELISEDGKLKEILQRVHNAERNNDTFEFKLIDIELDKIVLSGTTVAFSNKPRISSFEQYYEQLNNRKQHEKSLELGEYPEDIHLGYLNKLIHGQLIIQYFDIRNVFKLQYRTDHFELSQTPLAVSGKKLDNLQTVKLNEFKDLSEFWTTLVNSKWYLNFKLGTNDRSIEKFIIEEHNRIVQERVVPYQEYILLHSWMNKNYNSDLERNIYWQFCSNCRQRVLYNPRYPNHACNKCVKLIRDDQGNALDYKNTHDLKYIEGTWMLALKTTMNKVRIFIGSIEYFAEEARFGGVAHQLLE